jgi:hypothetical protein
MPVQCTDLRKAGGPTAPQLAQDWGLAVSLRETDQRELTVIAKPVDDWSVVDEQAKRVVVHHRTVRNQVTVTSIELPLRSRATGRMLDRQTRRNEGDPGLAGFDWVQRSVSYDVSG